MTENTTEPANAAAGASKAETGPGPAPAATTPDAPKPAPAQPKKRDALAVQADIDALFDLADQISTGRPDQIEALIAVQKKAKKLKLAQACGVHRAKMLGVEASSLFGEIEAMRNWANAARRQINQLEREMR